MFVSCKGMERDGGEDAAFRDLRRLLMNRCWYSRSWLSSKDARCSAMSPSSTDRHADLLLDVV